jgi:hypothetical protein
LQQQLRAVRLPGRGRFFIHGATTFGSSGHAARVQLLAKRLLLVFAMSLHSKKILTIDLLIPQLERSFYTGGALQCPKHLKGCGVKP